MRRYRKYLISLTGILISGVILHLAPIPAAIANSDLYEQINRFMEILKIVRQYYVEDVDADRLITGAINGMLEELDPHSVYIEPERLERVTEEFDGYFFGIGIEFLILNKVLTVVAPIVGTPSERLGIRPGDKIIKIDHKPTYGIDEEEVKQRLRGPLRSRVTVTIKRADIDEPFDLVIIRDKIPIHSVVAAFMLDERTAYVSLGRFAKNTAQELEAALARLSQQGMKRLLLDLRSNSGGYLDQAVAVVDNYLDGGKTIVSTRGRIPGANENFVSTDRNPYSHLPLIVMINSGSASASEIVAGAIQDWDRGLIVGETSFGKGLVQSQIELPDSSAIRITIARYYTPSGRLIQRPYQNGIAEYYLANSETPSDAVDSTLAATDKTAQIFWTSKGRKVYGGGGIRPDVTLKSGLITPFTSLLLSKRIFFEFGSRYALQHKKLADNFKFFLMEFQVGADIFDDFKAFIRQSNLDFKADDFKKDSDYIRLLLKSEIARHLWDSDKYYEVYVHDDYQVQEAVKLFPKSTQLAGLAKSKKSE
ncbi:S41 family peptidase [candidate division KSB1 bacterium]|nr:S41 family peptidase [candidate division KSB1 bacterium]